MGKDLREEKGEDLRGEKALGGGKGGKDLNRERVENILGRKRENKSEGETALGGKGGVDLNRERGAKILEGKGGEGKIPKGRK